MIKQRETKTIAISKELFETLEGATTIKPSALLAHLAQQWLKGNMPVVPVREAPATK